MECTCFSRCLFRFSLLNIVILLQSLANMFGISLIANSINISSSSSSSMVMVVHTQDHGASHKAGWSTGGSPLNKTRN